MGFLRNLLAVALAVAMAGLGVLFAIQNSEQIPLDVLIAKLPPRSLALWVLGALVCGGILGLAVSSMIVLQLRARLHSARRQIAKAQAELGRLRSANPGSARMGNAMSSRMDSAIGSAMTLGAPAGRANTGGPVSGRDGRAGVGKVKRE